MILSSLPLILMKSENCLVILLNCPPKLTEMTFTFLVELLVSTALKDLSYIWTIYSTLASTFKPIGSLSSTDENMIKHKLQRFRKVKAIPLKPHLIKNSSCLLPPSHLTPLHSHFLPGWKLVHGREDDRQSTAHELIVKMKKCWHFGGKISIPPHTSVPPGLRLPGFHLPSSSPCHQEVAGRGYLHSCSQFPINPAADEQCQSKRNIQS